MRIQTDLSLDGGEGEVVDVFGAGALVDDLDRAEAGDQLRSASVA
jgi:hypothetical protein